MSTNNYTLNIKDANIHIIAEFKEKIIKWENIKLKGILTYNPNCYPIVVLLANKHISNLSFPL